MTNPQPIRNTCPPGACICGRDELLNVAHADLRVLRLTRIEEQRLLERLENLQSLEDMQRIAEQLGIHLDIGLGHNEVRSMRGLEKPPEIAYRLLDAHDLFRDS